MSNHVHKASSVFPQVPGPKTTTKDSVPLLPVTKSGKAFDDHDMNQISPPVCKQALPSPPTSTPTHAPPVNVCKRKSVNFNDKLLRSARSVPNHRSRARIIATTPRTTAHHHGLVQPTLLSLRSHADQQKRARLSLAAPQLALPTSPDASRNRESNMRLLASHCSPLSAKSATKKKLARFYYNPSSHHQVPRRVLSPTLSTSAGSKQTSRPYSAPVLSHNEVEFSPYSDDSSDSDEEVASALLDGLPDSRRNSSRSRNQKFENELADEPAEELAELRPILKKTPAEILLAETVQQATAENGRPRISLDPSPMSTYRRVVAAVVSQTTQKSNSNLSSDAPSRTSSADATGHSESNHPGPSSRSSHQSANYLSSNGLTADADWPDDDSHSSETNPPSASGHPGLTDSSAIEAFLLSSLRSRLLTLQASLLPPPDQMRLDPVSPLAKLTSPQKLKLSKLGTLDGSPREPRGVLPRAPTSNPRLETRKSQPRTRGRSCLRSSATLAESTPPPATSGPLRTPESSPVRQAKPSPQVAITLREVEDAYISLHDHLDALMRLWQETGQLCDQVQQQRLAPLFADDVGAALMKCLVREVENLCRHDETTPVQSVTTPAINQTASNLRDEISRMMVRKPPSNAIAPSSNSAPAPSPVIVKSGASTNEIRRRVAEIETGQAALRCIATLWSWPSCMVHFDDSYTKRLLSLLVQIPKSSILRRKKNLLAIGLLNHIFKLQRLECATLEPHVSDVVDAIASTLYLSAGKSGDKGQKVLCLGLSALQQLTTQVPQHIAPKIGKFLEPLLASLTAPESATLRHQASAGLGALINSTKQEWHVAPTTHGRAQLRPTADALHKLQQDKKEAFKEKLSTFALAYFNDKNTFLRWALLEKQLRRSLYECDFGWVISVMATMIVLLGKRLRKLDPPLTRVFMPIINQMLRDTRTNHLVSQLWDYYIYVMFRWSADYRAQHPDQVWALDPAQLPFMLQLFRGTYLASATDAPSMDPAPSNAPTHITNKSEPYHSLLQPNKNQAGAAPQAPLLAADSRHPPAGSSANPQSQPLDTSRPSHHVLMAAYLYGSVGFIKEAQPHPPVCSGLPSELLAATVACPRFRYLDLVWDQMVEPFLPSILAGPNDEHRLHAYDVLAALFRYESADTPNENRWDLERLIHTVYHQPPSKPESPTQICLEEFTNVALSSAIVPVEIPALDPLWICSRYDRVLWIVACSIGSIQYIKSPNTGAWILNFPANSQREGDQKRVGPRSMFRIWQEVVKSIASVYGTCDWIFDTELSNSVSAISETLEQSIHTPPPLELLEEEQSHPLPNIFLFRILYCILKHGMGVMLMNRKLITTYHSEDPKVPRKISLYLKTLVFVLASQVAGEIADTLGTQDWIEYDVLTQMVMDDFIAAQKVMGSNEEVYETISDLSEVLKACTKERLQLLLGKCAMKVVTELMKIVEPGVLLDEPSLKPAAALMINACFKTIQGVETIDPALRKEFIEVFTSFLSRLTQGSLKILLDGCRTTLVEYLKDERNPDREMVYCALLTKLRNVNLGLLVSSLELSTLIIPPLQNQSSLSTISVNEFVAFVKTSAPALSEHLKDFVPAEKSSVSVLSSFPVACLQSSAADPSSSPMLSMPPPDKAPSSSSSMPEKSAALLGADNLHDTNSPSSSTPPGPRSLINESQTHSSVQEEGEQNLQGKSSKDSAPPTGVSPGSSVGNSNADMAGAGAPRDQSCCVSLDRVDPLLRSRVDSPPEESHQDRTTESVNALDDGLVKKPSPEEKKPIDKPHLENKPVPTDHRAAPESSHGTQIQHRRSPLQAPLEILPRTACNTQHLDPRLSSVKLEAAPCPSARSATEVTQACPDHASRPSASGSLSLPRPDVRDPALSRPPQRQATFENGHDMGCRRNVQLDVSDCMRDSGSLTVTLHSQDSQLIKYWVDPQLADPNTPVLRFDDTYQQIKALMCLSDRAAALPPNPRLTLLNSGHPKANNQSLKVRAIPSPGLSCATQQRTPTSIWVAGEAHESGVSPLTTSLGALDTLAPFAKRLPAKCLSFGSAPLEAAQSARQMLQNMTTRKPATIGKTTAPADTGSPAVVPPSSQPHPSPAGASLPSSSRPDVLAKRKRDEPPCHLAAKPSHPSPATSPSAASSGVSSQAPPAEPPCAGTTNSPAASDPAPRPDRSRSPTSPVAPSPGRVSGPSPLRPSLADAALDGDAPPPRKKAKCDQGSSGGVSGDGVGDDGAPAAECAEAGGAASPADARRRTGKKRARYSELQQLLRDAKQPDALLHAVSSSQLGRIAASASTILVARAARVTRSASRSDIPSDERLPN